MSITNIKELFCKRVLESNSTASSEKGSGDIKTKNTDEPLFMGLSEADAGITEYISIDGGFSAVIKQRFSDFHVHEIDMDDNVVRLTNFDIPVIVEEPSDTSILEQTIWDKLESLQNNELESVEVDVSNMNKEQRRDVHKVIKSKYGSSLTSNTVEKEDTKLIKISRGKENKDRIWPDNKGKYLHFVLYKSNLDTTEAINILATKLRARTNNFTYAGTKDKRAKTSQWVSMYHLNAARLNSLNNCLRDMRVGNFIFKNTPLKLGDLKGNHFSIALRNVGADDEVINTTLNGLKENGFINYFGLQRFGSSAAVPTHEIGKALVKGDFKSAVELILKPRNEKSYPDLREARKIWWETRDAERAFRVLRAKDRTIEGKLLSGLSKHGKNAYVSALEAIPRNVRLLYLHSYQSLLWNKVLSKRIQTFGLKVLEGDLVEGDKGDVHCLKADEVENFRIFDVLHPLPGHSVTYPNNEVRLWYEDLLEKDSLTSEKFKQTVKQYSLSGTYRHIVKTVKDLSWRTTYYDKVDDDLILSDVDNIDPECKISLDEGKGKFKALILHFSLDSSTYATMALREILKIDTSTYHQASLNSYVDKACDLDEPNQPAVKKMKYDGRQDLCSQSNQIEIITEDQ